MAVCHPGALAMALVPRPRAGRAAGLRAAGRLPSAALWPAASRKLHFIWGRLRALPLAFTHNLNFSFQRGLSVACFTEVARMNLAGTAADMESRCGRSRPSRRLKLSRKLRTERDQCQRRYGKFREPSEDVEKGK